MPSKNIKDLVPQLQLAFTAIKQRFEDANPGYEIRLICSHRTPEEQQELFRQGRDKDGHVLRRSEVVTYCDGVKLKSKHNRLPSEAFDVGVFKGGKYIPDCPLEETLGKYAFGYPVKWAGDFRP